jgi:hypothetical protein
MTDTGNVAGIEGGMRPATKDDQIDPRIGPKKRSNKGIVMNNVLEAVVKDLARLEETIISSGVGRDEEGNYILKQNVEHDPIVSRENEDQMVRIATIKQDEKRKANEQKKSILG